MVRYVGAGDGGGEPRRARSGENEHRSVGVAAVSGAAVAGLVVFHWLRHCATVRGTGGRRTVERAEAVPWVVYSPDNSEPVELVGLSKCLTNHE